MQNKQYHPKDAGTSTNLSEAHRRVLVEGSAIAPKIVAESGAWSIMRGRDLPDVFSERQRRRAPGVLFAVHRPDGTESWCFRPDRPDPDNPGHKYEQPPKKRGGAGNVLGVLPSQRHLIADVSVPVVFVEGTKKQLALITATRKAGVSLLVVAIVGVWNWLHDGGKPIPDMADIPLEGRNATVMFDSDMLRKIEVQGAARRLAEYLTERGADTFVTYFADAPDGSKVGADDFFAAGGTLAELRILSRRYDPSGADFARVRLSRDEKLREMIDALQRTYEAMPTATKGQCNDRASMRHLIEYAVCGKPTGEGVVVRAPVRPLSLRTRLGRGAQANSLKRLERDGVIARIDEPKRKIETKGAAYLLYAPCTESAEGGHHRTEQRNQQNARREKEHGEEHETSHGNAGLYAGVHLPRPPSATVPEMRPPKVIHTWERKDGRRFVVDSEYFYRLDKTRQEVVMYLLAACGEAHEDALVERLGSARTRLRDFRKRRLAPLMGWRYTRDKETRQEVRVETGPPIIECDPDGTVRLLPEWREALEEHRRATDEDGDTERQARKYRKQSKAYRNRDQTPADEQTSPLIGKEANRRIRAEQARAEKRRWVEEQRRKVGTTAATFLADELDGVYGVRFQDAAERWRTLHNGSTSDLWQAVHFGPFVRRRIEGDLYIDPEPEAPSPDPPPPEPKMPPKVGGVYVHGQECGCDWCAA
jgi:predicted metalloprotease